MRSTTLPKPEWPDELVRHVTSYKTPAGWHKTALVSRGFFRATNLRHPVLDKIYGPPSFTEEPLLAQYSAAYYLDTIIKIIDRFDYDSYGYEKFNKDIPDRIKILASALLKLLTANKEKKWVKYYFAMMAYYGIAADYSDYVKCSNLLTVSLAFEDYRATLFLSDHLLYDRALYHYFEEDINKYIFDSLHSIYSKHSKSPCYEMILGKTSFSIAKYYHHLGFGSEMLEKSFEWLLTACEHNFDAIWFIALIAPRICDDECEFLKELFQQPFTTKIKASIQFELGLSLLMDDNYKAALEAFELAFKLDNNRVEALEKIEDTCFKLSTLTTGAEKNYYIERYQECKEMRWAMQKNGDDDLVSRSLTL